LSDHALFHVEADATAVPVEQASYAALSYAGLLAGYTTVDSALKQPLFQRYLTHLLEHEFALSAAETTTLCQQLDIAGQQLAELSANGSTRWLPAIVKRLDQQLEQGQSIESLCFTLAAWLRFSMGFDGKGDPLTVTDPLAEVFMQVRLTYWDHIDELVAQYLQGTPLFSSLAAQPLFVARLSYWLSYILANGLVTAMQTLLLEVQDYSAAPRLAGGKV